MVLRTFFYVVAAPGELVEEDDPAAPRELEEDDAPGAPTELDEDDAPVAPDEDDAPVAPDEDDDPVALDEPAEDDETVFVRIRGPGWIAPTLTRYCSQD
jgi:hypothetical protein